MIRLVLGLLLCCRLAHGGLVVVDGTAVVQDDSSLLAAISEPSVANIYVLGVITLSAANGWGSSGTAEVNRTLHITGYPGPVNTTVDASQAARGVILCRSPSCIITVSTTTWVNPAVKSGFDFMTPVPYVFSSLLDGRLNLHDIDVVSGQAGVGLWNASNILYQPSMSWWVGNLRTTCQSTTAMVINQWLSYGKYRGQFLNISGWQTITDYVNMTNVRILVSQAYVCGGQFSQDQCQSVVQACALNISSTPLPADSCSASNLAAACGPVPPFYSASSDARPRLALPPPMLVPPGVGSGDSPRRSLWWVGLLVGLLAGALLLAGVGFYLRCRHQCAAKQKAIDGEALAISGAASQTSSDEDGRVADTGAVVGPRKLPKDVGDSGGGASSITSDSLQVQSVRVDLGAQTEAGIVTRRSGGSSCSPAGRETAAWSSASGTISGTPTGTGTPQPGSSTYLPHHYVALDMQTPSVFEDTLQGTGLSVIHSETLGSDTAAAKTSPKGSRNVVIDMVPPSPGNAVPQLARNPLGVTLQSVLGTGAYGTVYQATWNGQEVAVKIIKHQVSDADELSAILASKEAVLGTELDHPRIVRTLAHALVVPEGLVSDSGQLIRPGTVEAHIVSSLCDKGTLKAWLGTPRVALGTPVLPAALSQALSHASDRSAGPTAPPTTPLSDLQHPLASRDSDAITSPSGGPARRANGATSFVSAGVRKRSTGSDDLRYTSAADGNRQETPSGSGHVPSITQLLGAPVSRRASTPEPGSGALQAYPPLVCMPAWGDTGLGLHKDLTCHMVAVVDILLEVADGLSYLLSKGVVHGDLKPQNCLCCSDPNSLRGFSIQICDFGISRVLHGSKSHTTVSTPPGTLAYFAPELLSTCHLSPACDLYSFGIIMYELVTCRQPLGNLTMAQILYKKATGKVNEHLVFPTETPPAYVALAHACFSVEASARPSLAEVQAQLLGIREQLLTHWPLQQPPPPPPLKNRDLPASSESLSCAQ